MNDLPSHHLERISQAHLRLDAHDGRLTSLETHAAVSAERSQHIQSSLTDIKAGITWIARLVIGGIVMGAIGFLISGGFNVP